jgi:hypothetical protein
VEISELTFRFFSVAGEHYRVSISPREREGALGVSPNLNALVFETADGRWIGSMPVYHREKLEYFRDFELVSWLGDAIGRG